MSLRLCQIPFWQTTSPLEGLLQVFFEKMFPGARVIPDRALVNYLRRTRSFAEDEDISGVVQEWRPMEDGTREHQDALKIARGTELEPHIEPQFDFIS